jgi:hypothetical protein
LPSPASCSHSSRSFSTRRARELVPLATFIATPALAQKYAEPTELTDKGHYDHSGGRFVDSDPDLQVGSELLNDAPRHLGSH